MELPPSTLEVLQMLRRPTLRLLRLAASALKTLMQLPLHPQLSPSMFQHLQPSTFLQFPQLISQILQLQLSPSTSTRICPPSMAPYSPRGLQPYSYMPPNSSTLPALPMLQPSISVPMPSTRLPSPEMPPFTSTATQVGGSSFSVFGDTEWLEKALRGVSKCAYVMLRCALVCNRTQRRTQHMSHLASALPCWPSMPSIAAQSRGFRS
jgi:hypothetical protein